MLIQKTVQVTIDPDAEALLERFWRANPDRRAYEAAEAGCDPIADPAGYWPVELAEPEHADVRAEVAREGALTVAAARRWMVEEEAEAVRKDSPTVSQVHSDAPLGSDKPARKRKPRLDEDDLEPRPVRVVKADREQRLVYGVVLEPHVTDSQNDWETPRDIEQAAHRYLQKGWQTGDAWNTLQHRLRITKSALAPVESFVAPCDFSYPENPDDVIRKGSWVLVAKVASDALWNEVKNGTFTGWSVGGTGRRVDESLPA